MHAYFINGLGNLLELLVFEQGVYKQAWRYCAYVLGSADEGGRDYKRELCNAVALKNVMKNMNAHIAESFLELQ